MGAHGRRMGCDRSSFVVWLYYLTCNHKVIGRAASRHVGDPNVNPWGPGKPAGAPRIISTVIYMLMKIMALSLPGSHVSIAQVPLPVA